MWQCQSCRSINHYSCIKVWSKSNAKAANSWRCPFRCPQTSPPSANICWSRHGRENVKDLPWKCPLRCEDCTAVCHAPSPCKPRHTQARARETNRRAPLLPKQWCEYWWNVTMALIILGLIHSVLAAIAWAINERTSKPYIYLDFSESRRDSLQYALFFLSISIQSPITGLSSLMFVLFAYTTPLSARVRNCPRILWFAPYMLVCVCLAIFLAAWPWWW